MKYLKLFEGMDNRYDIISYDHYNNMKTTIMSKWNLKKLSNIITDSTGKMLVETQKDLNGVGHRIGSLYFYNVIDGWLFLTKGKKEILINACYDEWFRVNYYNGGERMVSEYYKCDQLDGVIGFLKDKNII